MAMAWRAKHGLGYAVSQIVRIKDMATSNGSFGASDLGSPMSALGHSYENRSEISCWFPPNIPGA